jgi:CheY-like chemotaxis protein
MSSILVIDDTEGVRNLCRAILEPAGYAVYEALSGHQGIRLFRESPTDAVITDMHMADGDGLEVIQHLRQGYPHLKILAVSGADAEDTLLRTAQVLGANSILLKPFGVEELHAAVSNLFMQSLG